MEEQEERNIPGLGMLWSGAPRMPKVLEFVGEKGIKEFLLAALAYFGCSVDCEVIWVIITKVVIGVENEICIFWIQTLQFPNETTGAAGAGPMGTAGTKGNGIVCVVDMQC